MALSPQSPVPTSHVKKSLSFDLSPSITTAVGSPIAATGLTESPDYHGLLHSPHDHDMLENIKAKKIVAEAMRGNTKLRQAVSELSQISATEALGKASKKQRLCGSRFADRGSPPGRARSASGASGKPAASSAQSWEWLSEPTSTDPGSSAARSRRADSKGDDTPEYQDSDEEAPKRRRKPRTASTSGSAGTRAGRTDRGNPSHSSTQRIPRNAAQTRTSRAAKPVIGKFAESQNKRSPSAPANLLPLFERQEPSRRSHNRHTINDTPDDSENDPLLKEREKTRLAEQMLKHTEEEAERTNKRPNKEPIKPWKNMGPGRRRKWPRLKIKPVTRNKKQQTR